MKLLFIGVINGAHGSGGAMRFEPSPDAPEILPENARIYIGYSSAFARPFTVQSWNFSPDRIIFSISGTSSPESANSFFDNAVFIEDIHAKKIYKEDYLIDDIIGCKAIDATTKHCYGAITEVWKMPANDVWVISDGETQLTLPVVNEFIRSVDIKAKQVETTLPPNFFASD